MSIHRPALLLPEQAILSDRFPELKEIPSDFLEVVQKGEELTQRICDGTAPDWVLDFIKLSSKEIENRHHRFLWEMLNSAKIRTEIGELFDEG